MENAIGQFIALVDGTKLSVLVAMIAVNFILGIAVSFKSKTFRLKQVGDFMLSRVMPYILGYFSVGILAVVDPSWQPAVTIAWGIIILALVGAIIANLKEIGINLPDSIGGNRID